MNTGYAFGPAAILAAMGGAFVLIVAAIYTLRWFIRRELAGKYTRSVGP